MCYRRGVPLIAVLAGLLSQALWSAEVELDLGGARRVCKHTLESARRQFQDPESSVLSRLGAGIVWKQETLRVLNGRSQPLETLFYVASFDIDNDGVKETVLKQWVSDADVFWVFERDKAPRPDDPTPADQTDWSRPDTRG
jgi:hypothetical protein